jgi:hypothetical protein
VQQRTVESVTDALPLERLEAEICELAGHLWAATARFLALLAEFDRREGWASWGMKSCAHWVAWKCGYGLVAAREHVRVARRLVALPQVAEAFGKGELSYAKVRSLCRVAAPTDEAELLELARHATTHQLERIVRAWRVTKGQAEDDKVKARHSHRYVRWHHDDHGSLVLSARLDPEDGALVVAALEAARDELAHNRVDEPTSPLDDAAASCPAQVTAADALVYVAQAALATETSSTSSTADRHLVVLHTTEAALSGDDDGGRCHLDDGPALSPETARRLACDSTVVEVTHDHQGTLLDVGRKKRTIPPALHRALRTRDGCCRGPGCTERRFVDGHHVVHWARGGETKLSNLVLLCRRHHRMVHEGQCRLVVTPSGAVAFARPDGTPIPRVGTPHPVAGPSLAERNRRRGLDVGPQTCESLGQGGRFDLGLTVDGLLTNTRTPGDWM